MGNTLGTCLTWILVGMFTAALGWDWGFHFLTIQIAVFCLIFWFIVSDSPDQHRWISEEEKKFIKESQAKTITKGKVGITFKDKILLNCPYFITYTSNKTNKTKSFYTIIHTIISVLSF